MQKFIITVSAVALLGSAAMAKEVTTCMAYVVGATKQMECSGGYNGKASMVDLYKKGWRFEGEISGANKFILVFEK